MSGLSALSAVYNWIEKLCLIVSAYLLTDIFYVGHVRQTITETTGNMYCKSKNAFVRNLTTMKILG